MPKKLPIKSKVQLPAVVPEMSDLLEDLTSAIGVPREVLASDDEIENAWQNLPSVLRKITPELRDGQIAKMCVAVAAGLFDGAINYVWNASISALRGRVSAFGLPAVAFAKGKSFGEKELLELTDAQLLQLVLELNLISEDAFFMLDQCRALRNSFSAAHPSIGTIDEYEVVSFANRCARHALAEGEIPQGVDINQLISALDAGLMKPDQLALWNEAMELTHNAQRTFIIGMLHGIYCDSEASQAKRNAAQQLAIASKHTLGEVQESVLVGQHASYVGKGDDERSAASRQFLEKLELLGKLGSAEQHLVVSNACAKLFQVHQGFDNFHNEPPFASRLKRIVSQTSIPKSVQNEFVFTVAVCAVGNGHGTSWAAESDYEDMAKSFTPNEIKILFNLLGEKNLLSNIIKSINECKENFKTLVNQINPDSVPSSAKVEYKKWVKQ